MQRLYTNIKSIYRGYPAPIHHMELWYIVSWDNTFINYKAKLYTHMHLYNICLQSSTIKPLEKMPFIQQQLVLGNGIEVRDGISTVHHLASTYSFDCFQTKCIRRRQWPLPGSVMSGGTELLPSHTGLGFPHGTSGKEPACQCRRHETHVQSLGREDLLEKGMATHSSILAWRIPRTEEPDGL